MIYSLYWFIIIILQALLAYLNGETGNLILGSP